LVLSHRHRDHVGGLETLLESIPVDHVYDAGYGSHKGTSGMVDAVLHHARSWPALVARGDTLHAGPESRLIVLHPKRGDPEQGHGNLNDVSLVLRVESGAHRLLFAGDAEIPAERSLLELGPLLRAEVLKVGHHGSKTSTHPAFLAAVSPRWAVVSCGAGNRYGHPDRTTLERMQSRGAQVIRTDRHGGILMLPAPGGGWTTRTFAPRAAEVPCSGL
jgi:beta-lactamase superfamily II metal-dependent hydrolase